MRVGEEESYRMFVRIEGIPQVYQGHNTVWAMLNTLMYQPAIITIISAITYNCIRAPLLIIWYLAGIIHT